MELLTTALSNGFKIASVLRCLHGKIVSTNSLIPKHDGLEQKNKKLTFFAPASGEVRAPPNMAWQ